MNAMFVRKDLHNQAPWLPIKERILKTEVLNVMFATKGFQYLAT
jgi:hypothetical protein